MRARVDESMAKAAHGESIPEDKLLDWLYDWGLYDEDSVEDWIIWKRSGYVVLPYPGSWREQPWWLRKDFLILDLVREYHDRQVDKPGLDDNVINPFEMYE
jgi:hypothetical protein